MQRVSYEELYQEFKRVLLKYEFATKKAENIAKIFTGNSLDGIYSHGINRFPVFIDYIEKGWIDKNAVPTLENTFGAIEQWNGNLGPGVLNATFCMQRAIDLAKEKGIACVALKNTNHWMRGGTYGWQAAEAGCIGINFTNTIGIMPPWGAKEPAIGNNPLIIAVPHQNGHIVLDMAMSQFSYGKMQEAELKGADLPFVGGYDENGALSTDPTAIRKTRRPLPSGMWKGSGLAIMLDLLASILSNGQTTGEITKSGEEKAVSQVFICIDAKVNPNAGTIIDKIINYTKQAEPAPLQNIYYPGERTLKTRIDNTEKGIPIDEFMWKKLLSL